jgi:hypothetical protein
LEAFRDLLKKYTYFGGMMASEIDKIIEFINAQLLGYGLAGVGGALGDSEGVWNTTGVSKFKASMAVKAVRVFIHAKASYTIGYPVKTGDAEDAVKTTADTTLPPNEYHLKVEEALRTRKANKEDEVLTYNSAKHAELNLDFHLLAEAIINNPVLVGESLKQHFDSIVAKQQLGQDPKRLRIDGDNAGGRRIKSNIRKINKNLSRFRKTNRNKSIRKNRRSYRRY